MVSGYNLDALLLSVSRRVGMQGDQLVVVSISLPIIIDLKSSQQNKQVIMNRQQLENYTKNHLHHGVNSQEVLEKFMAYQSLCSDPLLVFRYMEEKAVCTFLASFWIAKAEVYAQLGDYANSFQCLDLARSRIDEDQKQIMTLAEQTQLKIRQKMVEEMKKYPLKAKRSVTQFSMSQDDSVSSKKERQVEMLKLYEEKYGGLKREQEMKCYQNWTKKPKSWLFDYYQKEDEKEKMIEEQIHEHSVKISKDVKYHSMHTPIKARDPQRLTKTMDSVEILKKKRSTRQKSKKNFNPFHEDHQSEPDIGMDEDSNSRMMVSLPVGRKFASVKRRVTFKSDCSHKIQKIRNQEIPQSFDKIIEPNLVRDQEKMEQESELPEAYSENLSKK